MFCESVVAIDDLSDILFCESVVGIDDFVDVETYIVTTVAIDDVIVDIFDVIHIDNIVHPCTSFNANRRRLYYYYFG